MNLLAAEITARTGRDPGEHYRELTAEFGAPLYTHIDAAATPAHEGFNGIFHRGPDGARGAIDMLERG